MKVVLAEKPSVAREIAGFLQAEGTAIGHILDQGRPAGHHQCVARRSQMRADRMPASTQVSAVPGEVVMNRTAEGVFNDALSLPAEPRAQLADLLWASLPEQ